MQSKFSIKSYFFSDIMGVHCIVKDCKKLANKKHFFKVPENLTNVWLQVINRDNFTPARNSRICSDHFSPNDIINNRFLRKGAEPKISIIAGILYFFLLIQGFDSDKAPHPS